MIFAFKLRLWNQILKNTGLTLRRAVIIVVVANLFYFFIEFAIAQKIGSVSLFADSIDFLEDASINTLIAIAIGWSASNRAKLGMVMSFILLIPAIALLWTAWHKFNAPIPPDAKLLSLTGLGAMVVNTGCALLLVHFRHHSGSLTKAAFLSARNDAFANIAIILAGLLTFVWVSGWPDFIVGIGIAIMNADAAKEIWEASKDELKTSTAN